MPRPGFESGESRTDQPERQRIVILRDQKLHLNQLSQLDSVSAVEVSVSERKSSPHFGGQQQTADFFVWLDYLAC